MESLHNPGKQSLYPRTIAQPVAGRSLAETAVNTPA